MRRVLIALSAAALLIAVAVPATTATGPQAVTITSVMTITGTGAFGTFEASGPAVTRHLICPSGTVTDVWSTFPSDPTNFAVVKAFVCDGGGPTFLMRLPVTQGFTWVVQGGSGPYRSLFGSGLGSSASGPGDQQVTDTYTGTLVSSGQNQQ